ncbi:ABC transporter family protein [Antricoccus suffuscus]|uniref:ABC transporter family protein n=1 Tax=Antricoccus suffuscus TaxID=1629062 RepID=A0A2T0ZTP0_9ACTN|nr:ATP-binding cassette domain-containing protein [Antricoccus suffuscus]PRZ39716.1 ABC transporter family protein [Antricoccus suffuscus]
MANRSSPGQPGLGKAKAKARAIELLDRVGIPEPARRYGAYPFEMSGGMLQRVLIAMAISCEPSVLIAALAADPQVIVADEAVSALDVSTQAQILNLLKDIQAERGLAFLFITHDLGVVRQVADRIAVMNLGEIVEQGDADQVFDAPAQEYTQSLLSAVPEVSAKARRARAAAVSGSGTA